MACAFCGKGCAKDMLGQEMEKKEEGSRVTIKKKKEVDGSK